MQLSKRDGSPYWWVSFTDSDGKRHRQSTKETDKRVAQKTASALVASAASTLPKGNSVTLYAALDSYRAKLELAGQVSMCNASSLRDKTTGKLPSSAGRFHFKPDMLLHTLTTEDLQDLVEARLTEGNSATTIGHELKNLRAATLYAKTRKKRIPDIDDWCIPGMVTKTRWMTDTEWQKVYDYLSPGRVVTGLSRAKRTYTMTLGDRAKRQMQDAQDLMVCLTMCGGRWSEIAALDRSRFDLENSTVMVWGNKTQKYRMAPLPAQLKEVIERRLAALPADQKLLFPNDDGKVRKQSSRAITRAIAACGLNTPESIKTDGRCTVHSLRHTFASWLLQKGAGLADVQQALGHSTMEQTRRYAHLCQTESTSKLTAILNAR